MTRGLESDERDEDDEADGTSDGLNLDVRDSPGLSFEEADDAHAEELLRANGVNTSVQGLLGVLEGDGEGVLRCAAARTLGVRREASAIEALVRVARASDDLLRAEAGFAAARMGSAEAKRLLSESLSGDVSYSLGAPTAAGMLARLGDPSGWHVVQEALAQPNFLVRIVGAKELLYFLPFDGPTVDVFGTYARVLSDEDPDVSVVATIQLEQVDDPRARALLQR